MSLNAFPIDESPFAPEPIVLAEIVPNESAQPGMRTYVVPHQFGMSAILGIITALAFLFGALQWLDARPVFYLFYGVLGLVICLVQMFFGRLPRMASVVAGAVVFGVFVLAMPFYMRRIHLEEMIAMIVLVLPVGGFLGYLAGTCAAGIFLVMDYLERFLKNRHLTPTTEGPVANASIPEAAEERHD